MNSGIFSGMALGGAFGGGPPNKVTTITSGTGTFRPSGDTKWMFVTLVGGGGGAGGCGSSGGAGSGGQAGAYGSYWLQKTAASYTYAIGAGGTGSPSITAGGDTTFGPLTSTGGAPGKTSTGTGAQPAPVGGGTGPYGSNADGYGAGGNPGYNSLSAVQGSAGSGGLLIIAEY